MIAIRPERLDFLDKVTGAEALYDQNVALQEERGWGTNNSDFEAYSVDLSLPNNPEGLGGIVEAAIGKDQSNVGMDVAGGSEGVALQDLLRSGVLSKAILTNYADLRSDDTEKISDLHHVAGDLLQKDTWEEIISRQAQLAPDGLALVMHRPVGGLQYLPPDVYKEATHLLLDMVRPGGAAFLQVPQALDNTLYPQRLRALCESLKVRGDIKDIIPSIVPTVHGAIVDSAILIKHV